MGLSSTKIFSMLGVAEVNDDPDSAIKECPAS